MFCLYTGVLSVLSLYRSAEYSASKEEYLVFCLYSGILSVLPYTGVLSFLPVQYTEVLSVLPLCRSTECSASIQEY